MITFISFSLHFPDLGSDLREVRANLFLLHQLPVHKCRVLLSRVAGVRTHGRLLLENVVLNLGHVTSALIPSHAQSLCLFNPLTYLI